MARSVTDSKNEFQEAIDAFDEQRIQIEEDLRFSDPNDPDQWDDLIRQKREDDPGGKRLCLVHDQTGQYVANVAGQIEKSPPSLHAIPVGGLADKRTAELIDGRFRHIEHVSTASQHYQTALTSAARVGVGYLTVTPDFVNPRMRYMEPRIGSVADALSVIFDPWSVELDGKDATRGWVLMPMNPRVCKENWPGKGLSDFNSTQISRADDTRKTVIIAQEWVKSSKRTKGVCYQGPGGDDVYATKDEYDTACKGVGAAIPIKHEFPMDETTVTWRYLSGDDVLEETTYECDYIGIVPIYGYIGVSEGRMKYCGIPRRARVPQQSYNYHISELQAYMATAPRAPYLVPVRALQSKGLKAIWDKSNIEQRAFLPYDDQDESGQPVTAPSRTQVSVSLQNHEEGANRAIRDIQASIGMYQANIGAKSNVISGVAYDAQKEQGEASTAHFPSHLAASLGHLGNIVMQMDIRLHDKRRESPIINYDQSPGSVVIDPKAPSPYAKEDGVITINPATGTYGVRVVVGASYATQRAQTNRALDEIMRSNKELAPIIAPEWARTLDIPGSERLSAALLAMAPPPVKAAFQPEGADGQQDPATLTAELAQTQTMLQEAIQHAKEAQDLADQLAGDLAEAKRDSKVKEEEARIKAYEAGTHRMQVLGGTQDQMRNVASQTVEEILAQRLPEPAVEEPVEPVLEEPPMPEEPEGPSEIEATLLQGQQEIKNALTTLIDLAQRKRVRIPQRDKSGLITQVIDQMEEPTTETLQ